MNEFTMERNPVYVSSVGKPQLQIIFEGMNKLTMARSPMNLSNVGKSLVLSVPFKYMKELTMERNPVYVRNVGKPIVFGVIFKHITDSQWRETVDVSNEGKISLVFVPFNIVKGIMV